MNAKQVFFSFLLRLQPVINLRRSTRDSVFNSLTGRSASDIAITMGENNIPAEEKITPPSPAPAPEPKPDVPPVEEKKDIDIHTPPAPPQTRSQLEKAKFRYKQLQEEIVKLGGTVDDPPVSEPKGEEDIAERVTATVLRKQAEADFRSKAKDEKEVQALLAWYDRLGNADDAYWMANKHRTRNALDEAKRTPPAPGTPAGAGQRPPNTTIPPLSEEKIAELKRFGFTLTKPGRWEGKKMVFEYDPAVSDWVSKRK